MARKKSPSQLDREIAEALSGGSGKVKLKDRYSGGHAWLTFRGGRVVGAMGSDPKRYVGLTVDEARHHARYGGKPRRGSGHATRRGTGEMATPYRSKYGHGTAEWKSGYAYAKESSQHETRAQMRDVLRGLSRAARTDYDRGMLAAYTELLGDGPRSHSTRRGAAVEVDTSAYRRTHGAEPRGFGNWKFVIGAREYGYGDESDLYRPAEARGAQKAGRTGLSFAKAKEHAIAEAKRRGVTVVGVAP